jgi:hypothetical protein
MNKALFFAVIDPWTFTTSVFRLTCLCDYLANLVSGTGVKNSIQRNALDPIFSRTAGSEPHHNLC